MSLAAFLPTVGEDITFECLDRLGESTPPFNLTIWYDTCGRPLDYNFLERCRSYTKDVIVSYQNQGLAACMGYGMLYKKYEYIIFLAPDLLVHPDWFHKAKKPFLQDPRTGWVGENWRPAQGDEWAIDDWDRCPDGISLVSREAIDHAGSVSPAFNGRGPYHTELMRRISRSGYRLVGMNGLCDHGKPGANPHAGRDMIPKSVWEPELNEDNITYLEMDKKNYQGYRWWDSRRP